MLRLRDIMTTDLVTVPPDCTLRDAIDLFSKRHVSGAPVVAGGKVVGVISASDLLGFAASLPASTTVQVDTERFTDWSTAAEEMSDEDIPEPFFAEIWDDALADIMPQMSEHAPPRWDGLEEFTVAEIMTRSIVSLPPGTAVDFAAYRMRALGVHRVLVMQDDVLLGIVTTKDIADAVADRKLTTRTFVFQ